MDMELRVKNARKQLREDMNDLAKSYAEVMEKFIINAYGVKDIHYLTKDQIFYVFDLAGDVFADSLSDVPKFLNLK